MNKIISKISTGNILVDKNKTLHYVQPPSAVHCFISAMDRGTSQATASKYNPRHTEIREDFLHQLTGKLNLPNTGPVLQKTFRLQIVNAKSPDITNKVIAGIISHKRLSGSAIVPNLQLTLGSKKRLIH